MPWYGLDAARAQIRAFTSDFDGRRLSTLVLSGPPGSGKTSMVEEALSEGEFVVYRPSAEESTARELNFIRKFCNSMHSVDVMLQGKTKLRRAVFLDDRLPDVKSISVVHDALKNWGAPVLLIGCIGRSAKAPEVRRRAAAVVQVTYPSPSLTVEHLMTKFKGDGLTREAAVRCAEAADGCIPKAEQLATGELYGTVAEENLRGVDTTIFDDVWRGISLVKSRRRFSDVEVSVSCEPSMSAMILRESLSNPRPETREAFRMLSKTPPGCWFGPIMSSVVFMETAMREASGLQKGALRFPRCYTTTSSRTCNLRKLEASKSRRGPE